jgi:hypothetical protein
LAHAARLLSFDLATAEVIGHLDAARIPSVLLKGPGVARRLYPDDPGQRRYNDIDLLVAEESYDSAGVVLTGLGFEDPGRPRRRESRHVHGMSWPRRGAATVVIDLHWGFHGVGEASRFYHEVSQRAVSMDIAGRAVAIPDAACCALLAALHAGAHKRVERHPAVQAREDLSRALRLFDDQVWRDAAGLAAEVGAEAAFIVALDSQPAGVETLARLAVPPAASPPAWLLAGPRPRGALPLGRLISETSLEGQARQLLDQLFPSAALMRLRRPLARRGRWGLGLAYLARLAQGLWALPEAARAWRAATMRAETSGWRPGPESTRVPRDGEPGSQRRRGRRRRGSSVWRAARVLVRGDRDAVQAGWWALRAWRTARIQLRRAGLTELDLPRPPGAGTAGSYSPTAGWAMLAALRWCRASCLERAVVRQAWLAHHGDLRAVVIGVTPPDSSFRAHAWLEGDPIDTEAFTELSRYP